MLDIKLIRDDAEKVKAGLAKRNGSYSFDEILNLDGEKRKLTQELNLLQEKRNKSSEEFGRLKKTGQEIPQNLSEQINTIRKEIQDLEAKTTELDQKIENALLVLPNIPDDSVPLGKDAKDNKVIRQNGTVKTFDFKPKSHWEIGEKLGILDFETASKISGARFSLLKGQGCALERAIISFFLDTHTNTGYKEIFAPYLVNKTSMRGTGQLPKFEEDLFKCKDDELYLIPTAEVSVTNIHRDEFLEEKNMPVKYCSYSACFRREAGSYGKDTKGLIRNHQFNKVELVKFVKPEDSANELELLTQDAEKVLALLGIPYRVVLLCSGDMGFGSAKTYDIEVWMPSENTWREISSCSNFKDFQTRRMNIKMRYIDKRKDFVHTLNGSGVAVGRTFAAILENYQQKDGTVSVPDVLKPYLKFDKIG